MIRRAPIWNEDPELREAAAAEKARARPDGHDREGAGRRIELVRFDDMAPQLAEADLVEGVLGGAQLATILGAPGSGKTFAALDVALHVAAGIPWLGHRVRQGATVYIAAEAGRRIFNRVEAWKRRHRPSRPAANGAKVSSFRGKVAANAAQQRRDGDGLDPGQSVPFYAVPVQLDLCTTHEDLEALIDAIHDTCGAENPVLIVVDTIARVMAGGNENSPEDMGALITSADRLRDEFGANVTLIHHHGKDASRGARGHSSLKGAVDTEIEVARDDDAKLSTLRVTKQRDGEIGAKIHFALDVVTIGENEETGEPVTSCVVVAPDADQLAEADRGGRRNLGRAEQVALNALKVLIETQGEAPPSSAGCPSSRWVREEAWRAKCYRDGVSNGKLRARQVAFQRATEALLAEGLVGMGDGFAWLAS